jgi:hypothetical protein
MSKNTETQFFSVVTEPINDIQEASKSISYDFSWIPADMAPLQKAKGPKRIYFIPVSETVPNGKESEYLAKFGKKPVTHAPNYLLGVMAKLNEDDFPHKLKFKDIVAVSSSDHDIFLRKGCGPSFLRCYRRSGKRELNFVDLSGDWTPGGIWVFIAEDIESN